VLVDAETGALVEFNEQAHEALGYSRHEFKKLKIPDFEVIESAEGVVKHIKKIVEQGGDTFETQHRTKSGKIRDIEVNSRAIYLSGNAFVQSIWRDITEHKQAEEKQKRLQQELYLSSRLASIGELAAGVAHEINNPLTGILGFS
jgi:PAS domain S-box-containing protein